MATLKYKSAMATRRGLVVVIAIAAFGFLGTFMLIHSKAATPVASVEVEQGTKTADVKTFQDANASGGSAITFSSQKGVFATAQPAGNPRYAFRLFGGADDPARIPAATRPLYSVYLLSPYMTQIAGAIRTANPSALIYMYKDSSSARGNSPTAYGTWCNNDTGTVGDDWGIDYCDAYANHNAWFMTKGGQPFEYSGYQYHWHMNVAAAGYKERWASNVIADLQSNSVWDGVFIDNMLADIRAYVPGSVYPDQHSSLAAGQTAYKNFMDYVGQQIKASGFGVVGNNNGARLYPGVWANYTAAASGGYDEFWTTFGGTAGAPNNLPLYSGVGWEAQIAEVEGFNGSNKLGIVTGQDSGGVCPECMLYGLASYLLSNNGRQVYQSGNVDAYPGDYISAHSMFTWQLGDATSARTEIQSTGSSLFQRTFAKGLVLVNASSTATYTVNLTSTYKDENGTPVSSVNVSPSRARILRLP